MRPAEGPRIQRTELLNGLRVVSAERASSRSVVSLLVKAGSHADPPDKAGLAYLTAQSLCFSNAKLPPQRWKDELEFLGARIEVRLDADSTVIQAEVPPSNVEAILSLLSRLIVSPVYIQDGIAQIKIDLHSSQRDEPQAVAQLHLREMVFGRTVCARPERGSPQSIQSLSIGDIESFHQSHYLPNNSALIVIGGPPMPRIGNLVREKFGSWIKGRLQPAELSSVPVLPKAQVRIVDEGKLASDASILLGHAAPVRQSPDFFPLTLANIILSRLGKASRLEQAFSKLGIPHQTLGSDLEFRQTCGWFRVSAQVPTTAVAAAFAGMLDSIEGLKASPPSEGELSQAKSVLLSNYTSSLESATGLANQLVAVELFDLARDFLSSFPLRVEQVSAERIQEAAKNHLSSTQITGVIVGDGRAVRDGLAEFRTFEISAWREPAKEPNAH